MRDSAGIPYCSRFFGQWDGESHPEQVSVASLISILESDLRDGVIELACHPGYVDATLTSSYRAEREVELRTLCDRRLRRFLDRRGMLLIGFGAAPATPAPA